jgi:hypothetical protein
MKDGFNKAIEFVPPIDPPDIKAAIQMSSGYYQNPAVEKQHMARVVAWPEEKATGRSGDGWSVCVQVYDGPYYGFSNRKGEGLSPNAAYKTMQEEIRKLEAEGYYRLDTQHSTKPQQSHPSPKASR